MTYFGINIVFATNQSLDCQVNQHSSYNPNHEDRCQGTNNLCNVGKYNEFQMHKKKLIELPARYHPKLIFLVAGLVATHKLNSEIMKEAKSVNKWAASVAIANELAKYPP